jgi:hypothetical protein
LLRREFFADEKRKNEIVSGEFCFADEVSHAGAAAQTSRALNQFSHGPRLRVAPNGRKLDAIQPSGVNASQKWMQARDERAITFWSTSAIHS